MNRTSLHNWTFLGALVLITLAFAALMRPFHQPIFWAATLVILFWPVHRRLLERMPRHPSLAALASLLACLLVVVLPLTLIVMSLIAEVARLYQVFVEAGGVAPLLDRLLAAVPPQLRAWLDRLQGSEVAALQQRVSDIAGQGFQFLASRMLSIGQNTLQLAIGVVLMLYLMFFFFLDGPRIVRGARAAIPMDPANLQELADKFVTVLKATIKGSVTVALVQGALGGLMFWIVGIEGVVLWAVVMAVLSLLPAVGTWLVWGPAALWLLASGEVLEGLFVIGFGLGVISIVDNILRPILIGKETRMPDYLVLLSTLGGLAVFGLTGFVVGPVVAALFVAIWQMFIARREALPESGPEQPGTSGIAHDGVTTSGQVAHRGADHRTEDAHR
ncbi:MAG: AI-2E family transporter [Pseudoxanthomonas suwonensis]|nr:AI-2E family transporter [Pseudoxanthomonas suwonensis]